MKKKLFNAWLNGDKIPRKQKKKAKKFYLYCVLRETEVVMNDIKNMMSKLSTKEV